MWRTLLLSVYAQTAKIAGNSTLDSLDQNVLGLPAVELTGLNHRLQHCTKRTVGEYGEPSQTISPPALHIVGDWIVLHTRGESDR
jgi:hypothetical protein